MRKRPLAETAKYSSIGGRAGRRKIKDGQRGERYSGWENAAAATRTFKTAKELCSRIQQSLKNSIERQACGSEIPQAFFIEKKG